MNPITQLLESVIGQSVPGKGSNIKLLCPFDGCRGKGSRLAGEHKLEVDVETVIEDGKQTNYWHCWSCNAKGKSIYSLLKALDAPQHVFDQLQEIIKYTDVREHTSDSKAHFSGILPKEYKSLAGKLPAKELKLRHAKAYLKKRGLTENDILKYSIGFCEDGEYSGRVIVPSYDAAGKVNFIIARTIHEDIKPKYKNPTCSRDIIPFDLFVNWSEPIILTEGAFDLMAIKRNVIPLLDKEMQPELMKKILGSSCKKVYLAIDPDALKQMVKYAEILMNEGKQVFTIDFSQYKPDEEDEDQKVDPGKMGFEAFTRLIQKATRLTTSKLMKLKINSR